MTPPLPEVWFLLWTVPERLEMYHTLIYWLIGAWAFFGRREYPPV